MGWSITQSVIMRRVWLVAIVLSAGIILVSFFYPNYPQNNEDTNNVLNRDQFHYSSYKDRDFYEGIELEEYVQSEQKNNAKGGIVSHHLLAKEDIAKFFAEFRDQAIDTIVLIGPNHFSSGENDVAMTTYPFVTPWGEVGLNIEVIEKLQTAGVAVIDPVPFNEEHSISALVPYIAYNLPNTRLVPIVLNHQVERIQLDELVESLKQTLPANSVVVASVDFSHHLNRIGAYFHDDMSESAIINFDYERLFSLEVDSSPSLYTLLTYLESEGAQKVHLERKISVDYTGSEDSEDTTSYMFAHFTMGKKTSDDTVTSLHFGDISLARNIASSIDDGLDPFQYIQGARSNFLKGSDIIMANFEGVLTNDSVCDEGKEVVLKAHKTASVLLKKYNFTHLAIANNHIKDCFSEGESNTITEFDKAEIKTVGAGESYLAENINDTQIAIHSFNLLQSSETERIAFLERIKDSQVSNDYILVHIHWGYEYMKNPNAEQQAFARQIIDSGADVIIGHHPHVIGPVEKYKDGIVFYSLGNFIFDQDEEDTKSGFGVGLTHSQKGLSGYIFPYTITAYQPRLLPYKDMEVFCEDLLSELEEVIPCSFNVYSGF